jgi:hypothetical protein
MALKNVGNVVKSRLSTVLERRTPTNYNHTASHVFMPIKTKDGDSEKRKQ